MEPESHSADVRVVITFTCPSFTSIGVELLHRNIEVHFEPQDGVNTFVSNTFELGTVRACGSVPLTAKLSFCYKYSKDDQEIEISDKDYPSSEGMKLITEPEGTGQICVEHAAYGVGYLAEEAYANTSWNYHSPLMRGADKVFKAMTREANDSLIRALHKLLDAGSTADQEAAAHAEESVDEEQVGMAEEGSNTTAEVPGTETLQSPLQSVVVRRLLPELDLDDYHNLCSVHDGEGNFVEVFNPFKTYDPKFRIAMGESVLGGTGRLSKRAAFANVRGSTKDKKIGSKSWLKLWESYFPATTDCTSKGYSSNPKPLGVEGNLVGGHCIKGLRTGITKEQKGKDKVFIIPICNSHNQRQDVGIGNYMKAIKHQDYVKLKNYFNP